MHIYGNVVPEIRAVCAERRLALHEFGWQPAMERAGLRRDALIFCGQMGMSRWQHQNNQRRR